MGSLFFVQEGKGEYWWWQKWKLSCRSVRDKQWQHASKANADTQKKFKAFLPECCPKAILPKFCLKAILPKCCPSRGWLTSRNKAGRIRLIRPLLFFNLFGDQLGLESVAIQYVKSTYCIYFKTGAQKWKLPHAEYIDILNPEICFFAKTNQCKAKFKRRHATIISSIFVLFRLKVQIDQYHQSEEKTRAGQWHHFNFCSASADA